MFLGFDATYSLINSIGHTVEVLVEHLRKVLGEFWRSSFIKISFRYLFWWCDLLIGNFVTISLAERPFPFHLIMFFIRWSHWLILFVIWLFVSLSLIDIFIFILLLGLGLFTKVRIGYVFTHMVTCYILYILLFFQFI